LCVGALVLSVCPCALLTVSQLEYSTYMIILFYFRVITLAASDGKRNVMVPASVRLTSLFPTLNKVSVSYST